MAKTTSSSEDSDMSDWIRDNVDVDVSILVDAGRLLEYVSENFNPGEVFGDDRLVEYIRDEHSPDGVFDDEELEEWALNNGFVRREDDSNDYGNRHDDDPPHTTVYDIKR